MEASGARVRHAAGLTGDPPARALAASPGSVARYEDAGGVADMVRVALVVNAVVSVLVSVFAVQYLFALDGVSSTGFRTLGAIQTAADRVHVGDGITFWSWFLCGVVFIVWTHRTYSNVSALGGSGLRFRSGWAIAGWLVPPFALWRPKQIVNDVWRASDRTLPAAADREEWGSRPTPLLLGAWWALWVLGALAERLSFNFADSSVDSARTTLALRVGAGVCLAAAALLAVWVVTAVTRRQQERARALGVAGGFESAVALGPSPERPVSA